MNNRILIVQTAFLGDMVLTTPLFRAVRRVRPDAHVTLLTTPGVAPLVEEDPHLDGIIVYDKKGGESFGSCLAKVREGDYDTFIGAHRSTRTALLGLLARIPVRIGFQDAGFRFAYNKCIARPLTLHEVDRNLQLLKGLDEEIDPSDRLMHLGCTDLERGLVAGVLASGGVSGDDKVVGLCPGSIWPTKRWMAEGYGEVGKRLAAKGYKVAVLGGPGDAEVAREVAGMIGPGAVFAAGLTPVKALVGWLERFELLVTNDSGPWHSAAAVGTPTVVVLGPTAPELGFVPFQTRSEVVEVELECRPCGWHGSKKCKQEHWDCMRRVTPDAVMQGAERILAETGVAG